MFASGAGWAASSTQEVVKVVEMADMVGTPDEYDVAVIGGGAAGLSAAVVLGRSRRRVVVIDAGEPRNAPADGVHGFLSRDGVKPAELLAAGRTEAARYGVEIRDGAAVDARPVAGGFEVTVAEAPAAAPGRDVVRARRLVVTTGLVDELPDVDGLRERWGRDVVHCPYCHGWEVRDQPIGVLGGHPRAVHVAQLFRQLSPDVVLFTHTGPPPSAAELEELAARDIRVVPGTVAAVEVTDDQLSGVRLADGTAVPRGALAVGTRLLARSAVLDGLGLHATPDPLGIGERIEADPTGRTAVDGVWVAGNVTNLMAQVVVAAADGHMTGAVVNADLVAEDTRDAVARRARRAS
jgi:thioredoxin reductase